MTSAFATALIGVSLVPMLFSQAPDIVLLNGRVFTGVSNQPLKDAVAIHGSRIQAIGTTAEIAALAGPRTRRIDLSGHLLVAGFNDAHIHFSPPAGESVNLQSLNPTCQEALRAVGDALLKRPGNSPLLVRVGYTAFFDSECTPAALDRIAPDRPVLLRTFSAHASILNTAATRMFDIRTTEPPKLGEFFGKNMKSRVWDGVVHEYANFRLARKLARYDPQEWRTFLKQAAEFGITSLQVMAYDPKRTIEVLSEVQPAMRIRIIPFLIPGGRNPPRLTRWIVPTGIADRVTVNGVKWIIDGTGIERSSAFRESYADQPDTSGAVNFSKKELRAMFLDARRHNAQLVLHCTGNRAIDAVLEALEATGGWRAWAGRRIRIEHANTIMPDQISRLQKFGIVVVVNPPHLRLANTVMLKSLMRADVPLVLASDNAMNPYLNLMLASTYPNRPEEVLTREEATVAYTHMAAYAEFRETEKGTIETGKLADLAILSQNIFEVPPQELAKVRAVLTMVGGRITHSTEALKLH